MADWKDLSNQLGKSGMGYGEGLAKSFLWSLPEIVGIHAPPSVAQWRAQNPGSALGTELAGWALPLGAWAKASGKIGPLATAIDKVGKAERAAAAPIRTRALQEMVRFAPFEAARVGIGTTIAPAIADDLNLEHDSVIELGMKAGVDLALAGAATAGFEVLKAAGKKAVQKIAKAPGVDLTKPVQVQIRELRKTLAEGQAYGVPLTEEGRQGAAAKLNELSHTVRYQEPKDKYIVEPLDGDVKFFNRIFKVGTAKDMHRMVLSPRQAHLGNMDEYRRVTQAAGFNEGFEGFVQFPRVIRAQTKDAANRLANQASKMQSIDDSFAWTRDGADGLYVLMKKVSGQTKAAGGVRAKADVGDEWVVWKTDQPGMFAPSREAWKRSQVNYAKFFADEPKLKPAGVELIDDLVRVKEGLPLVEMAGLRQDRGNVAKMGDRLAGLFGAKNLPGGELARRAGLFAKKYVAPAMFQFTHSIRGARLHALTRYAFDKADEVARTRFVGAQEAVEGNLFSAIATGGRHASDSPDALIDKLWENGGASVNRFLRAVQSASSLDDAVSKFGVDEAGLALLRKLKELDEISTGEIMKTEKLLHGRTRFVPMENHYGISHVWEGDWRVPLYTQRNTEKGVRNILVGVAGGRSKGAAEKAAEELRRAAEERGVAWKPGSAAQYDFKTDQRMMRQMERLGGNDRKLFRELRDGQLGAAFRPGRMKHDRHNVSGYKTVFSKNEFKDLVHRNMRENQRYIADLTVRRGMGDDFAQLAMEDPETAAQLAARLDMMSGQQGPFAQWQNRVVDELVSPVLGANSASKIVGGMNSAMFHLTLGFFNHSYAIANAMAWVQTALPHIAFLASAGPERLMKYYTYWPVAGAKHVDGLGVLDMFKLGMNSFREMGKPTAELQHHFARAIQNGVVDPRFVEEIVGQNSKRVVQLKEALTGKEPFTGWLKAVSEFVPGLTERFARGHSFTLGHIVGRDMLGLEGDMLYTFAKDFTEKTQFLYTTADRANVITGPLGSALGLFKNWVMHYMNWMLVYTDEALTYGNWKPLLWSAGGTTALGGVGALPLFETANSISKWMSDETIMQHTYNMFGGTGDNPHIADAVFYGLPALLGVSIQNQVAAPFADPGQDAARLFSFAYTDRLQAVGRAAGAAIDRWGATGQHPATDRAVRDNLIRAFMPKNIYRWAQLTEDRAIKSLTTGYPMVKDLSVTQRMLYVAGLNPRRVEIAYRVNQELWQDQQKMLKKVQNYGKIWAEATMEGRPEVVREVLSRAVLEGVDVSSVIKSAKTRMAKGREDMIGRQFTPQGIAEYRRLGLLR